MNKIVAIEKVIHSDYCTFVASVFQYVSSLYFVPAVLLRLPYEAKDDGDSCHCMLWYGICYSNSPMGGGRGFCIIIRLWLISSYRSRTAPKRACVLGVFNQF
mmetsp:Transcript_32801/g.36535  ORF Transcript_32801/g.36535 Transcript_32801/m.36535 type:complete len:102 (+) Transcript_32801:45-350(+)